MKDVIKFLHHKGAPLLLAAASGVVIFGLYPGTAGLLASYYPPQQVYVANVYSGMPVQPATGFNMYIDEVETMEDGTVSEQI